MSNFVWRRRIRKCFKKKVNSLLALQIFLPPLLSYSRGCWKGKAGRGRKRGGKTWVDNFMAIRVHAKSFFNFFLSPIPPPPHSFFLLKESDMGLGVWGRIPSFFTDLFPTPTPFFFKIRAVGEFKRLVKCVSELVDERKRWRGGGEGNWQEWWSQITRPPDTELSIRILNRKTPAPFSWLS